MPTQEVPEHKRRFLEWLNRFSRIPRGFAKTMREYTFTEEELLRLKPQIEARYKLKAEYAHGRARGA